MVMTIMVYLLVSSKGSSQVSFNMHVRGLIDCLCLSGSLMSLLIQGSISAYLEVPKQAGTREYRLSMSPAPGLIHHLPASWELIRINHLFS